MKYADYQATPSYDEKQTGAAVRIAIFRATETVAMIESLTGINFSDEFEQVPVEEAGNDGIDEIPTGRHTCSGTINGFWSSAREDALPSRQTFLGEGEGEEYTIMELGGDGRVGIDLPLRVVEGAKINRVASGHGARGLKTIDIAFIALRRYTGAEWAAQTGG